MSKPKKLIEVALPIKEISAESVRDKSIRHGHISTLHLWWARRPLPVCRAIVFASLVPDPEDVHCPQAFKDAIDRLLGAPNNKQPHDPYKTYPDIPWTPIIDPMDDNRRNRLQMFIGKFTHEMQQALLHNKPMPAAGKQLTDDSLIKWDNKNNAAIINKARKLIWVAHNAHNNASANQLFNDFDQHLDAITKAENALYETTDRHLTTKNDQNVIARHEATEGSLSDKTQALDTAINAFLDKMPRVFDPFAGGGAIPLEAARLGCRSFGNDINPVAHIIQKGSLEFPQKFGKPITYSKAAFIDLYQLTPEQFDTKNKKNNGILGNTLEADNYADFEAKAHLLFMDNCQKVTIKNRLAFDVAFYAKKLLAATEAEIDHFYPTDQNGQKPIAYYWARVGTCANPSCRAEVPLLKGFYLCNTKTKQVHLKPTIVGNTIEFTIENGYYKEEGWIVRKKLLCPCCGSLSDIEYLRQLSIEKKLGNKLLAVIEDSASGKTYRLPRQEEIDVLEKVPNTEGISETLVKGDSRNLWITLWGIDTWGDMFSKRQLLALQAFVKKLNDLKKGFDTEGAYEKAIITYLGILIDRIAVSNTSFGRWHTGRETLEHPFARQAIPMMFDYPESNMFCSSTGSALNQLDWITRYIESESSNPFWVDLKNASSGDKAQFEDKYLTAVVTDPPYYDAIAYADLSDFFYVWLKRTLGDVYPLNFATPQTPKAEECTALKHHHNGKTDIAKAHFENKLLQIFDAIEHQTTDIVSIMFAHQSTEAWTTLCNSILGARMNITGSWAVDTEMANRSLGLSGAVLESSVTVSCTPLSKKPFGDYQDVKRAIEGTVAREVEKLYALGFRNEDLLTACFGQAVSEFGQYERVEKADGSEVTVAELLTLAKTSAFNALLKGFEGDDFTKFYIVWMDLNKFSESDFDDAAQFTRVGLSINVADLFTKHLFVKNGNKQTLATFEQRVAMQKNLGERETDLLLDTVHKAMWLYKNPNRALLLQHISKIAAQPDSQFWRVLDALCAVLPNGSDDHTQATGLKTSKDDLIRESKENRVNIAPITQPSLFD